MTITLSNGLKMPPIGFGTSTGLPNEEVLEKALDAAFEVGFRHIDTAFFYRNEKIIGRTLQKWFKSGKLTRGDVFITTKLPFGGVHPDTVEYYMKESLSNLQLDYVDLYLIHLPIGCKYVEGTLIPEKDEKGRPILHPKTDHSAIWKKMEDQVTAGRTKSIGLSNYNISQIETVLKSARINPACLQIELHLYLQQRSLVDFCTKNNIAVVGFSPLGSPDHDDRMKSLFPHYEPRRLPTVFEDSTVATIARKHSKSAAQVVLRFLVQSGVVPIPKSMNPERIRENFDVFGFELDGSDVAALRGLEVGEAARVATFRNLYEGLAEHPDYPFRR